MSDQMIDDNSPSQPTILVVDDVPENIDVLIAILERAGYRVETAQTSASALSLAQTVKPQMILMDIMLPGDMDGFKICERLKADEATRDIPLIFLTALAETSFIVRGFEVGAVDVITKPFRSREVLARITTHLTVQQQKQEITALRDQERRYFEKLSQMKDEVMQMTSHDLKNPLHNMRTAVALLRRHGRVDDEQGAQLLDLMEVSTDYMQHLIEDLLDLARIETGQAVQPQATSVKALLGAIQKNFALSAKQKGLHLSLALPDADFTIDLDPERIAQALNNLLSNAIKYTERGTVILEAQLRGANGIISVRDTGLGIPESDLPHIFEKFYRVRTHEHLKADGTGLGLSIVHSIAEQHGGTVEVSSTIGEGTTFSLVLPLKHAPEAVTPQ